MIAPERWSLPSRRYCLRLRFRLWLRLRLQFANGRGGRQGSPRRKFVAGHDRSSALREFIPRHSARSQQRQRRRRQFLHARWPSLLLPAPLSPQPSHLRLPHRQVSARAPAGPLLRTRLRVSSVASWPFNCDERITRVKGTPPVNSDGEIWNWDCLQTVGPGRSALPE